MLQEIQSAIKNMTDNMKLTDYVYGEVISIEPLKIKVDQKLTLNASIIILTSAVIEKKINYRHTHGYLDTNDSSSYNRTTSTESPDLSEIIIVEGLAIGDKVLMLRVENGQKFIVLSKVVI